MNDITPQQAREQLEHAEAATDRRAGERRVHGLATAAFGLLVGGYTAVSRVAQDGSWGTLTIVGYVLLLVLLTTWQSRAARAVPRHSRRTGYVGLGATVALMLTAVMAINYREAQGGLDGAAWSASPLLLVVTGLVVATPMLVAGTLIARGDRR